MALCVRTSIWSRPAEQKYTNTADRTQKTDDDFSSLLVNKLLQSFAPILNEIILENPVVTAEWQLAGQRLAGQCRDHDLQQQQQ